MKNEIELFENWSKKYPKSTAAVISNYLQNEKNKKMSSVLLSVLSYSTSKKVISYLDTAAKELLVKEIIHMPKLDEEYIHETLIKTMHFLDKVFKELH